MRSKAHAEKLLCLHYEVDMIKGVPAWNIGSRCGIGQNDVAVVKYVTNYLRELLQDDLARQSAISNVP
mgnify:CR=1 FL=1